MGAQLGQEISRIINDQKMLEMRYQEILQEQQALKNRRTGEDGASVGSAGSGVKSKLQSVRLLTRMPGRTAAKASPNNQMNANKINNERTAVQNLLAKTVRELREGRVDTLVNMVEDEYRKKELLQTTINRYAQLHVNFRSLWPEKLMLRVCSSNSKRNLSMSAACWTRKARIGIKSFSNSKTRFKK
jgi:hypothetical protein